MIIENLLRLIEGHDEDNFILACGVAHLLDKKQMHEVINAIHMRYQSNYNLGKKTKFGNYELQFHYSLYFQARAVMYNDVENKSRVITKFVFDVQHIETSVYITKILPFTKDVQLQEAKKFFQTIYDRHGK